MMLFQNYFNDLGEHRLLHFIEVPGQDPLTKIEKKEEKNMTEEKKTEQKEKDESPDALLKHAKGQALERQQRAERMRMEFDDTNKETDDKAKRKRRRMKWNAKIKLQPKARMQDAGIRLLAKSHDASKLSVHGHGDIHGFERRKTGATTGIVLFSRHAQVVKWQTRQP